MPRKSQQCCGRNGRVARRDILAGLLATTLLWPAKSTHAAEAVNIGLNPLFLDSDIELLVATPDLPCRTVGAARSAHKATDLSGDHSVAAFRAARRGVGL